MNQIRALYQPNSIITSENGDCDITAFMSVYPYTLSIELVTLGSHGCDVTHMLLTFFQTKGTI